MIDCLSFTELFVPYSEEELEKKSIATRRDILLKVAAVALASFAFFTLQRRLSMAQAGLIAGGLSSLTWLSEVFLRQDPSYPRTTPNWFNTKSFHSIELALLVCFAACVNLIAGMIFSWLNISIGQYVQELIKKRDPRILFVGPFVAPICEEILFRGFLKERLEDGCFLFSRFILPLSDDCIEGISNIGQAIIFGAAHVNAMQTRLVNAFIFTATSLIGFGLGCKKYLEASLISCIGEHMTINTCVTARLLIFNH